MRSRKSRWANHALQEHQIKKPADAGFLIYKYMTTSDKIDKPYYRGRFAPSPTGPLHFGSLVAAVGSYLDARSHQGDWLVRIEDIDPPREVPGAADDILRVLEALGMEWNGPVIYQSQHLAHYTPVLEKLKDAGRLYPCACTRREIADSAVRTEQGAVYPGNCRKGLPPGRKERALRMRVDNTRIEFRDRLQGVVSQHLGNEVGDFIVRRADSLVAYQLAVVIDDEGQSISHVVRGSDLLDSTPRQIYLQQQLGLHTPSYLHLPAAVDDKGDKLSKQTCAQGVEGKERNALLLDVLNFLNQQPPALLVNASLEELWQWAISNWRAEAIPTGRVLPAPAAYYQARN